MKKIELMAPAGSFPSFRAAVQAGADSVYLGLREFNMRDSAKNFSLSELKKVGRICKENKVKLYLTLNTIIYDNEIKKLESVIKKVRETVDAVICWDLSIINLCRKYEVPFHISTQASVSNTEAALFYRKLGAKRVNLARELNLRQIKKISEIIDVEIFGHGAMCVSVSGRCFTSQFLQNKSANRGQCAHPCRRAYKITDPDGYELELENNRVMSAKDLCTLPFIEKIKKSGICAFKIEGRNRSPEYVAAVVKVYRKALDNKLNEKEKQDLMKELKKVYNREFSSGFYLGVPLNEFTKTENGQSYEKKVIVGRIEGYWKRIGVAHVKIFSKKLKLGDEVYIKGRTTGLIRAKIEDMEISSRKISEAGRGDVGIKLPLCRKGDEVYLIVHRRGF
jgi:putative protease